MNMVARAGVGSVFMDSGLRRNDDQPKTIRPQAVSTFRSALISKKPSPVMTGEGQEPSLNFDTL
jgi:hypothetical protein